MSRTFYAFAVAIGVTLSLLASMTALKLSWDTRQRVESEFGKNPYKSIYRTDEQAAVRAEPDSKPIFADMTDTQIARRALISLCRQIECANLDHYVYSFGRDGSDVEGAFWYRPLNPKSFEEVRRNEHFLCRFRNESWVFCYVSSRKRPKIEMVFARTASEAEMKDRDLDRKVEMRKRYPNE